jgi:three-Cys-motif partner protein
MPENAFFDETKEQSVVKMTIVTKYFLAWARIVGAEVRRQGNDRICYIDLFAGPGRYRDGTLSTPFLVLQMALDNAIGDTPLSDLLVSIFNDKNLANCRSLEAAIKGLPGGGRFKHKPLVLNDEVGKEMVKMFGGMNLVPTLCFVDPWGYKGLSLALINAVIKDWACECIFFFNYNRINMGLTNPYVTEHMNALFGEKRAEALRAELEALSPEERELTIVEALCEAMNPDGKRYVLPFRFLDENGTRTSHHLVFVTKHPLGYEIMKGIMAKESSEHIQGVATFEYSPAGPKYPLLHAMSRPLDRLGESLLSEFAGRELTMARIHAEHNLGTPFVKKNYKEVLKRLEASGKIRAVPPASQRTKNTFADDVLVIFPKKRKRRD